MRVRGHDAVDVRIGASRVVVEQHQPGDTGHPGEPDGVLHGGVPEMDHRWELRRGVLAVVQQDVGIAGEGDGRLVYSPNPWGPAPRTSGLWSGR